jgi:acyl-coenzyme A synthetase/AMP-(fatty) acid ligase
VNTFAAVLRDLGVVRGDRVVIYMPMMAEAIFAMLACARLGAIHSVAFGGFAATNLATGVKDQDKGQVVFAYVVPKDGGAVETDEGRLEQTVKDVVDERVGAIARPAAVYVVEALPKTRSGKLLRRSIQAIVEGGEPRGPDHRGPLRARWHQIGQCRGTVMNPGEPCLAETTDAFVPKFRGPLGESALLRVR